jgi:H+-transporting ATPase
MRRITAAGIVMGVCKLGFSTAVLAFGKYQLGLSAGQLQTLAFITLVFGAQALVYVVRERRHIWSSKPGNWVLASSAVDIAIVSTLAFAGILMEPLPWHVLASVFAATIGFALILDQIKLPVKAMFNAE